jgi:CRISPR-associated protein Cmr4
MEMRPYLLHALSPLHAGTGQAADVIDLPIARMKATGIPIVPGSSIKGVLRDWFDQDDRLDRETHRAVFGPATNESSSEYAGALMVLDARLLALPVRSFRGTFAWVSSPLLLELARRDLKAAAPGHIKAMDKHQAVVADVTSSINVQVTGGKNKVFLEDLDLDVQTSGPRAEVGQWAKWIGKLVAPSNPTMFENRFLVVDDETMTFLWETGTQVDTRVRIDSNTRTVANGALWSEESLPPETLLIGLTSADKSRNQKIAQKSPNDILDVVFKEEHTLQFGGKATVGRGICRMIPTGTGASQ